MATCLTTMNSTVSSVPLGGPFTSPSSATHQLRIVSKAVGILPEQELAMDLQSPLKRFIAGKSQREYQAGESVYSQGDPANAVFYIFSGKVKLSVVSMNGKEAVIAHLPEASFFG